MRLQVIELISEQLDDEYFIFDVLFFKLLCIY